MRAFSDDGGGGSAARIGLAAVLLLGGCSPPDGSQAAAAPSSEPAASPATLVVPFEEVFEVIRVVTLEESDEAINVDPTIRAHLGGGVVVADRSEQAVRRYGPDGALVWQFGRGGAGPGEFSDPTVAIALDSTRIAVADAHERLTLWNEATREVERTLPYEQSSVDDLDVLDDTLLVYSSRAVPSATGAARFALHVVDSRDGRTLRSFFAPPITDVNAQLAGVGGWTSSVAWRDTIAAVFALSDTVYMFDPSGNPLAQRPFGAQHFRAVTEARPEGVGLMRWISQHTLSTDIFRTPDGDLIAQYNQLVDNVPEWRLVLVRGGGDRRFEIVGGPRLYAIADDFVFVFDDPDTLTPNALLLARLRGGRR